MSSEIKRWDYDYLAGGPTEEADGDYVLHSDHEVEVARLRAMAQDQGVKDGNEISRLRAEAEANRVDAERYRWLRDTPWFDNYEIRSVIAHQQNALWDKTIDAAMGASA